MPGAGSLSRTAINYQARAATRFSGLITAAFVAVTVLVFAPLASYVPKALLAGLLMVAAARLFDLERLRYILRGSFYDGVLLISTAFSAVAIDIEFAILIGSAISIAWYVTRASKLKDAELVVTPERVVRTRIPSDPESEGVLIYDFEGELFFGAAPDFEHFLESAAEEAVRRNIKYIVFCLVRGAHTNWHHQTPFAGIHLPRGRAGFFGNPESYSNGLCPRGSGCESGRTRYRLGEPECDPDGLLSRLVSALVVPDEIILAAR